MNKQDIKRRLELKFAENFPITLNPETNRWDSKGSVDLSNMNLSRLPLKFGKFTLGLKLPFIYHIRRFYFCPLVS